MNNTLWPELNKLYGHGYEIASLAVSSSGGVIASSCKSQSFKHSAILVWDPITYQVKQRLEGHNYTVLQLVFSKCEQYIASASRDRQLGVFKLNPDTNLYETFWINLVHSRLLYCLQFSDDSKFIVTGSRDKSIKIFAIGATEVEAVASLKFGAGVSAVEFCSNRLEEIASEKIEEKNGYLIWVGLETGEIKLCVFDTVGGVVRELCSVEKTQGHSKTVNRIRQKNDPNLEKGSAEGKRLTMASCSDDYSVRIHSFHL